MSITLIQGSVSQFSATANPSQCFTDILSENTQKRETLRYNSSYDGNLEQIMHILKHVKTFKSM
jgi:hypothetical protein